MKKSLFIALLALSGYASAQAASEEVNPLATPPIIEKTIVNDQAASAAATNSEEAQEESASETASSN